jgi:hypothetical protein
MEHPMSGRRLALILASLGLLVAAGDATAPRRATALEGQRAELLSTMAAELDLDEAQLARVRSVLVASPLAVRRTRAASTTHRA